MNNTINGTQVVYQYEGHLYRTLAEAPAGAQIIYIETPWVNRTPETMEDIAEDIASGFGFIGNFGFQGGIPAEPRAVFPILRY